MNEIIASAGNEIAPAEYFDTQRTGFEGVDAASVIRPYITIAQGSSEMAKRGSPSYIDGLAPGMFYSPSTKLLIGEKLRCIVVKYYRNFVVYEGKDPTGKPTHFLGTISSKEFDTNIAPTAVRDGGYNVGKDGRLYLDKRNFIILLADNPDAGLFILSLSSTGIQPAKKLITMAMNVRAVKEGRSVQAPIWSNVWELGTNYIQNPKGGYYQITDINRLGWVSKQIAPIAKGAFEELFDNQFEEVPEYVEEEPVHHVQETVQNVFGKPAPKPPIGDDIF